MDELIEALADTAKQAALDNQIAAAARGRPVRTRPGRGRAPSARPLP